MRPFRHEALLYADDVEYVAGTVPFVEQGLAAGEPVLVAVPEERLAVLRDALPTDNPLLQLADMETIGRNPAWIIPQWVEFAQPMLDSGRTVRGIGEPVWPSRTSDELTECAWHESLINMVFADAAGFSLLCPYDTVRLAPDVIADAHSTHPAIGHCTGANPASNDRFEDDNRSCPDAPLPPIPPDVTWVAFDHCDHTELRASLYELALAAGLRQPAAEDAVVAINEAVGNTVRHGGGSGRLCTWTDDDAFVCEVRDAGHITDPLAGRRRPLVSQIGGRGLWLITQLCDLVQIRQEDDGQVLRLRISDPG